MPKAEEAPPTPPAPEAEEEPMYDEDSDEECKGLSANRSRRLKIVRLKLQGVESMLGVTDAGWEPGLPTGWIMQHDAKGAAGASFLAPNGARFPTLAAALASLPATVAEGPGVGSNLTVWYEEGKKRTADPVPYTGIVVQRTEGAARGQSRFQVLFDEGSADWVDCHEDEWAWGKHSGPRPGPFSDDRLDLAAAAEDSPKPKAKTQKAAKPPKSGGAATSASAASASASTAPAAKSPSVAAAAAAVAAAAATAAQGSVAGHGEPSNGAAEHGGSSTPVPAPAPAPAPAGTNSKARSGAAAAAQVVAAAAAAAAAAGRKRPTEPPDMMTY